MAKKKTYGRTARGQLITDELERVTQEGDVRDDVLLEADSVRSTWTDAFALDEELVVAVEEFGRDLEFQSFVVERTPAPLRVRPLRPPLSLDVCESKSPCPFAGVQLHAHAIPFPLGGIVRGLLRRLKRGRKAPCRSWPKRFVLRISKPKSGPLSVEKPTM